MLEGKSRVLGARGENEAYLCVHVVHVVGCRKPPHPASSYCTCLSVDASKQVVELLAEKCHKDVENG